MALLTALSCAPAARSASAPTAHTASPAPGAAARQAATKRWLTGLTALQTQMNRAGPPSGVAVTPHSLRVAAGKLTRCTPELAALGPHPGPLRSVYRQVRQACASFGQGAKCYAVAAKELDSARAGKLLATCAADFSYASALIGAAVTDGFTIPQ